MSDKHQLTPKEQAELDAIRNYVEPSEKKKESGPYEDLLCIFCNTYVDDDSGMCDNDECELNDDLV
tara:strand:+ start:431 stop:628 length:198 start_codon:yes stop_codon:yes gene_type:complete